MSTYEPAPSAAPPPPRGDEGSDLDRAMRWVRLGASSIRRRRAQVVAVFFLIVALVCGLLAVMPRTYHVQTRLLTHRSRGWIASAA